MAAQAAIHASLRLRYASSEFRHAARIAINIVKSVC